MTEKKLTASGEPFQLPNEVKVRNLKRKIIGNLEGGPGKHAERRYSP